MNDKWQKKEKKRDESCLRNSLKKKNIFSDKIQSSIFQISAFIFDLRSIIGVESHVDQIQKDIIEKEAKKGLIFLKEKQYK